MVKKHMLLWRNFVCHISVLHGWRNNFFIHETLNLVISLSPPSISIFLCLWHFVFGVWCLEWCDNKCAKDKNTVHVAQHGGEVWRQREMIECESGLIGECSSTLMLWLLLNDDSSLLMFFFFNFVIFPLFWVADTFWCKKLIFYC